MLAALPLSSRADQTVTATEMVIRLTVQPRAEPKPALRYLLLPDLKEMNPGNPIPNYLKCTMEPDFFDRETFGRSALRLADRAARLDKPDWMKDGKFVDAWDRPIEYRVDGKKFQVWSCGPDGKEQLGVFVLAPRSVDPLHGPNPPVRPRTGRLNGSPRPAGWSPSGASGAARRAGLY